MSGHSKWATIKRKKGAVDAKRAQIFTKHVKEITVSARLGGGDVNGNARLRLALERARAVGVPKDTIEKAIKRGTGELEGITYEEVRYEAYGPQGVALLIDCATDNKNRTVAEIRNVLMRHGGHLVATGSVAWAFAKEGGVTVPVTDEEMADKVLTLVQALEGHDDVQKVTSNCEGHL